MNASFWQAVAAISLIVSAIVTWALNRRHQRSADTVAEDDSISRSIGAVAEANHSITETVMALLVPMQRQIDQQEEELERLTERHREEIDELREAFAHDQAVCANRLNTLMLHITLLRSKMRTQGIDPGPPPDLEGFTFD